MNRYVADDRDDGGRNRGTTPSSKRRERRAACRAAVPAKDAADVERVVHANDGTRLLSDSVSLPTDERPIQITLYRLPGRIEWQERLET